MAKLGHKMTRSGKSDDKRCLIASRTAARSPLWCRFVLIMVFVCLLTPSEVRSGNLSSTEVAGITLGSASVLGLGLWVRSLDSTRLLLINGPLPLETTMQRLLGGRCRSSKMNFLDNSIGSIYTPTAGGVLLLAADISWPRDEAGMHTPQDMFLYTSGLVATKGITGICKGLVARPRPNTGLEPEISKRPKRSYAHNHQSFFSGHTSSAFFAMAFLNKRSRSIMRRELTSNEYRSWRWAPPSLLFGWASFVGLSRIHAHKHYLSDVLAGALAGYLMAELFYSFGDEDGVAGNSDNAEQMLVRITFAF